MKNFYLKHAVPIPKLAVILQCAGCGKWATDKLEWKQEKIEVGADAGKLQESLYCTCGTRVWNFVEVNASRVLPENLVLNEQGMVKMSSHITKSSGALDG